MTKIIIKPGYKLNKPEIKSLALNSNQHFKTILIVGIGLIGGSIAKALKKSDSNCKIWAHDVNIDSIEKAKKEGVVEGFCLIDEEIEKFDLIISATNISAMMVLMPKIAEYVNKEAILIDTASVKNLNFFAKLPDNFVPCHPIAGSEKTGYENSSSELFEGKKFLICTAKNSSEQGKINRQKVFSLARKIGGIPEEIDAKLHDRIFSLISHLPQFLSFCFSEFSPKAIKSEFLKTAFRLDKSDAQLWKEIFDLNQKNLEIFYQEFFFNLEKLIFTSDNLSKKNLCQLVANLDSQGLFKSSVVAKNSAVDLIKSQLNELNSNFAQVFFRILVVIAFLQIKEIKSFINHAGSGFFDFISILNLLLEQRDLIDDIKLETLITQHRETIRQFFKKIS